jgi:hypothetical protein
VILVATTTPLHGKSLAKNSDDSKESGVISAKRARSVDPLKMHKAKQVKSSVPVARVPSEPRSSKVIELVGGVAIMDGYPGVTGNSGLFIGPDFLTEAGFFYGTKGKGSNYLDGWIQGKFFLTDYLFLALGGGVGKLSTTHEESLVFGKDTWKESATKLRLYSGIGPQFTFQFLTVGLQASAGFGKIMGQVENDLPDDNKSAQDKADDSISIKSGLNYNIALFVGGAF